MRSLDPLERRVAELEKRLDALSKPKPEFPSWSPDSKKILWSAGRYLYIYDIATGDSLVADSIAKATAKAAAPAAPATADTGKKEPPPPP